MLTKPGEFFEQLVVHTYAGEPVELRQLVRLRETDWTIASATFEIAFQPYDHKGLYTLLLTNQQRQATFLHTVPSVLPSEKYLFQQLKQPLATSDDEKRRAAFILYLATEEADEAESGGRDYIDAVLLDFLKERTTGIDQNDLTERLSRLPINPPRKGEHLAKWMAFFEARLDEVLDAVQKISSVTDVEVLTEWQPEILDLWADLRWYNPHFATTWLST
ncbi:MAG: hypothetical protein ACNA8W_20810 [Bradymonadaceae bacterium]